MTARSNILPHLTNYPCFSNISWKDACHFLRTVNPLFWEGAWNNTIKNIDIARGWKINLLINKSLDNKLFCSVSSGTFPFEDLPLLLQSTVLHIAADSEKNAIALQAVCKKWHDLLRGINLMELHKSDLASKTNTCKWKGLKLSYVVFFVTM